MELKQQNFVFKNNDIKVEIKQEYNPFKATILLNGFSHDTVWLHDMTSEKIILLINLLSKCNDKITELKSNLDVNRT